MDKKSFAPSIILPNGQEYTPEGWMWVLAFALRGVKWAVIEADKPEFRARIRTYFLKKAKANAEEEIAYYERELETVKKELRIITTQLSDHLAGADCHQP